MVRSVKRKASTENNESGNKNTSLSKQQKKHLSILQAVANPDNTFGKCLTESGVTLGGPLEPNILNCDQVIFRKRLVSLLQDKDEILNEFLEGLMDYWGDAERFRHSLGPTLTSESCESSSRGKHQDSFVKLLLGTECLELPVANCLLEKLAELSEDDGAQEFDYPHVIMSQFRWLERIHNSKDLIDKMLEIVSISGLAVQREIISCIPDIVDDSRHSEVGDQLRDLMLQDSQLTTVVIDAIGNLNINGKLMNEVRQSLIKIINSVSIDDLPVVLRFILQSSAEKDVQEVVSEVRESLELSSLLPPMETSTPMVSKSRSSAESGEILTLNVIKSSIKFQRHVADAWMKNIDAIHYSNDFKIIDLIVIFILHGTSTGARRRIVENILRVKLKHGILTEQLVQKTFDSHSKALVDYFGEILAIAESYVRSPEVVVSDFGSLLYKLSFTFFDNSQKQEVVGALVTHIGSGIPNEIDAAFGVLKSLVFDRTSEMVMFSMFLKNVLYYSETLELHQVRDLFSMLSILTLKETNGKSAVQDDVHMIIRKQLSSSVLKYKRIGIVGAIMSIGNMAKRTDDDDNDDLSICSETTTTCLSGDIYKQVIHLLEMVKASVNKMPRAAALFYDELAQVVKTQKLDHKVLLWISESVASDFQETYLVDAAIVKGSDDPQIELLYDLDDAEEGGIAVNILPLLLSNMNGDQPGSSSSSVQTNGSNLICLTPHFRLLGLCEKALHNGSLEGIDALLGCPLVLFKRDVMETLKDLNTHDKEIICCALFIAVNWIRESRRDLTIELAGCTLPCPVLNLSIEIVSIFASQKDSETKAKIMSRLETLTILNEMLERCLLATPSFLPPPANFDFDETKSWKSPTLGNEKKSHRGLKRKQKPAKDDKDAGQTILEEAETEKDGDDDADSLYSDKGDEKSKDTRILPFYRPFLRELDISVFQALQYSSISKAVYDTDLNTKESETFCLKTPQLLLLLEDLEKKLNFMLMKQHAQRRSFLTKVSEHKNVGFTQIKNMPQELFLKAIIDLLPSICGHLEAIYAYFQTLADENDGILDCSALFSDQSKIMGSCLHSILSCLFIIFSWSGHDSIKHRSLLQSALKAIGRRMSVSSGSDTQVEELARDACLYIEKTSDAVHNINTAWHLVKLIQLLSKWDDTDACQNCAGRLANTFLSRDWMNSNATREKGKALNDALLYLVRLKIATSEDQFAEIEELCSKPIAELIEKEVGKGDKVVQSYPTLTKSSVSSYYKAMIEALADYLKRDLTSTNEDSSEKLVKMNIALRLFHMLVSLVKTIETKTMLVAALKYGRIFLEIVLKHGMPILDKTLRTNKDDVHGLLRSLQQSTRCLQHYCSHSKTYKDLTVANHVPALKKCLETFVFRVKAMLAVNSCHTAFWLGNLKNRDIQGNELSSQVSKAEEEEEEEEEEEADGEVEGDGNDEDNSEQVNDMDEDDDEQSCSESF